MAKPTTAKPVKPPERESSVHIYLKSKTAPSVDFGGHVVIHATGTIKQIGEDFDGQGYVMDIEPADISVMPAKKSKGPNDMDQHEYENWRKKPTE